MTLTQNAQHALSTRRTAATGSLSYTRQCTRDADRSCQNFVARTSARPIIVRTLQRGSEAMLGPLWLSTTALQHLLECGQEAARQLEEAQLGPASSFKVDCQSLPTLNPFVRQVIVEIALKLELSLTCSAATCNAQLTATTLVQSRRGKARVDHAPPPA